MDLLKVSPLFENSCVLITGASGFLGKVLLEKLLFSQPRIRKIFLLIRPRNDQNAKSRLDKSLESPLFNRIRCIDEHRFNKLVPIDGDLMLDGMDLREEDREMLEAETTVVFHCAATVKFDEALRVSIQMNVIGTQRLISLCHRMQQLKAFVHASTAYANCNLKRTEERIYVPKIDGDKLVEATGWMSTEMLDAMSAHLLDNRPNTYTFAKALAESQLSKEASRLPIIIIRPSIIGAIWREPLPGWIDNVNGPTGIFLSVAKGFLTDMCGNTDANADIIPADIVASMLIVAAAHRARMATDCEIPMIHCTSGQLNPLKWGRIVNYLERFLMVFPIGQPYFIPSTQFHRNRKLFMAKFYAKHLSFAYALDAAYWVLGKEPNFVRIYGKIWRMIETLGYFTTRGWIFESQNAVKLWESLQDEDKKLYCFDVRRVDWDKYLFDYLMGVKIYLLKESVEDLEVGQANMLWRRQLNLYGNGLFFAMLVRLFAWRRPQRQRWMLWFSGFLATYLYQNSNQWLRPSCRLRTIEEYKEEALVYYSDHEQKQQQLGANSIHLQQRT